MRRQGSWGQEVRQGTTSQRCVYAVRAGFPGLCSVNFYYASPFISTNFNYFIHISQATSWYQNLCVLIALESKGKIKGGSLNGRGRKGERCQTNSKFMVCQMLFFHFLSLQNTHVPWQDCKSSSNDNAIVCILWILFQSQNTSFHWWLQERGMLIIPTEKDFF